MSDDVIPAFWGLPGAVLAHLLQLGCLTCAWGNKHRGVCNAQLYVEKTCGQYHTVIFGEGFLDRITILDCINANPGFICKRKGSWLFNIKNRQNACIFHFGKLYTKFTILTIFKDSSVALSTITLLCYHHHPLQNFFIFPNWNFVPIKC